MKQIKDNLYMRHVILYCLDVRIPHIHCDALNFLPLFGVMPAKKSALRPSYYGVKYFSLIPHFYEDEFHEGMFL